MKYFFDTEFIEDGNTIDMISIGIVSEDGRELYLCNKDCDLSKADEWVKDNVLIHLPPKFVDNCKDFIFPWVSRKEIKISIENFIDKSPEFWAYYADYDWVVFCQLFGRMIDLPNHFPKYCLDLKQYMYHSGFPKEWFPVCEKEHDALADAKWNKKLYYGIKDWEDSFL